MTIVTTLEPLDEAASGGVQTIELVLSGRRALEDLWLLEDAVVTEQTLSELVLRPGGGGDGESLAALEEVVAQLEAAPVLVEWGLDGNTRRLRFDPALGFEARQWACHLVAAFRFVVPADGDLRDPWEVTESDGTGEARVTYTARTGAGADAFLVTLERRKLAYAGDPRREGPVRLTGGARATWDAERRRVLEAHLDEAIAFQPRGVPVRIHQSLLGDLRLIGEEIVGVRGTARLEGEDGWISMGGDLGGKEQAAGLEGERRARELGEATLDDLLAALDAAVALGAPDSHEVYMATVRLGWFLALHPGAARELERHIRGGSLSGPLVELALVALGQAATAEAQAVMTDLIGDLGVNGELRAAALRSAFQIESLDRALLDQVLLCCDPRQPELVSGTAMLLLGRVSAERACPEGLDPLESLLAMEQAAFDSGHLEVWLEALGNAGSPRCLEALLRHAQDSLPEVRAAALDALGGIGGPEIVEALIAAGRQDGEPGVRACAVEALGRLGDAAAVAALCELALGDAEPGVRQVALAALVAGGAPQGAVLETIQWCAREDPDESVRSLAQAILAES